jgi:hypothetical protein
LLRSGLKVPTHGRHLEAIPALTRYCYPVKNMQLNTRMHRLIATLFVAGGACTASAFTYADADLLLVFRKDGFNDVEYNLGSVSNYLGKPDGTRLTVSNWDLALVRSNFNNSMAGVKFTLLAATAVDAQIPRVWLTSTDLDPDIPPTDLSGSRWRSLRSLISSMGNEAQAYTATNATQVYKVPPSDPSSFTFIASGGGQLDASTISGLAPFTVEAVNPTTLAFYEIKTTNSTPRPPAALVGSFYVNGAGALKFVAGPILPLPQPNILTFYRSNTVNRITFPSADGVNYRLRYSADVESAFTTSATAVPGDGSNKILSDNTSQSRRFYAVEAMY